MQQCNNVQNTRCFNITPRKPHVKLSLQLSHSSANHFETIEITQKPPNYTEKSIRNYRSPVQTKQQQWSPTFLNPLLVTNMANINNTLV